MILVDTGPLVALGDTRDRWHQTSRRQLEKLAPRGLLTCEAVIVEACFLLPHGTQRLRLQNILDGFGVVVLQVSSAHRIEVFNWLAKYAEHQPDWADGCIAVLSAAHRRLRVWTYDREFTTTWRRPDGTAIPLAGR